MTTTDATQTTPADHQMLLADIESAIRDHDEIGLTVALGMARCDFDAYYVRVRTLATEHPAENDPAVVQRELKRAIQASARPGQTIGDELAEAILRAVSVLHAIRTETPEQRAIRMAFAEARRLMDMLGNEHPLTLAAVYDALELAEPGCVARKMRECGIDMPKPKFVSAAGEPLLDLAEVAQALGATPEELVPSIERLEAAGLDVRRAPAGWLQ